MTAHAGTGHPDSTPRTDAETTALKRVRSAPVTNEDLIERMLLTEQCADVPGKMRKYFDIVVNYADVLQVYERIAKPALGRTRWRGHRMPRAAPADFAEWNAVEANGALSKRYGCSFTMLARWRAESGLKAMVPPVHHKGGKKPTATPPGFTAFAPGKSIGEIAAHFGISREAVRRMRAEHGIAALKTVPRARQFRVVSGAMLLSPIDFLHRDCTRAGMAADYLRRFGPVFRCSPTGRAETKGTHWRRGSAVLTDEELIGRAERNGWAPDAWRLVA